MAKESGLGAGLLLAGYDITGDVTALGRIGGGPKLTEACTGIDKQAYERLGLQRDGSMAVTSWFNPASNMSHDRLGNLPTTDVQAQYWHRQVIARPVACIVAKQANYDGNRASDGSFTFETEFPGNAFGLEWCTGLTAFKRSDTTATNGTGVDLASGTFAGSSTFGLQAYLQVFSFTGTSVTIKLQESSDNGGGDAFADVTGGGFTAVTAIGHERIQTSRTQTVERYLRVVTTGTFSQCTFAVAVQRNDTLTAF
jgi:hypothetical protein